MVYRIFELFKSPHSLPSPGLSDTGRMVAALSDSYLPGMSGDHAPNPPAVGGGGRGGPNRVLSPDSLMPPLSMQDRHPSAPQLASMLVSSNSMDVKPMDIMVDQNDQVHAYYQNVDEFFP